MNDSPPRAWGALAAALAVAILGFLPIPQWIMGHPAGGAFQALLGEWLSGGAIVLGVALVLAILSRRVPALWQEGAATQAGEALDAKAPWIALAAVLAYAASAWFVFSARPLTIDEILQVYQGWIFTQGRLALATPQPPEFYTALHVVDHAGRTFTHFPPGWPAMLAPGIALGAAWLVAPVCGGVTVLAWWWYLRAEEPRAATRAGALLLMAFAPFALFMTGSQMNHAPMLMWITLAMAALAHGMKSETPRPGLALLAGFSLGAAATLRPVDAFAFALPAAVIYLVRALREPARWRDALAAAAGVAVPVAFLLWFNARTTGAPLVFGYELLWGKRHGLGFHLDPYGEMHTPRRGLATVSAYFLRLQTNLFEWPVPSLLAPVAALALWRRRLAPGDRYLMASAVLLLLLYVAYWFDGVYLGPRFIYALLPMAALWTARLPDAIRHNWGSEGLAQRLTMYAFAVAIVMGAVLNLPIRTRQYSSGLRTERWDADRAADAAGVRDALVLVRESWGSQVIARLWGLDVSRSETETIYRRADTCLLEQEVSRLEADGVRGAAAWSRLAPLMRDSLRVTRSEMSPDGTERVVPGTFYPPACVQHILADRQGYTHYPPLLTAHGMGNVFARELGARDTLVLSAHPGKPLYLLTGTPSLGGSWMAPRFIPLSRDSVLAAARAVAASPQRISLNAR